MGKLVISQTNIEGWVKHPLALINTTASVSSFLSGVNSKTGADVNVCSSIYYGISEKFYDVGGLETFS